MYRLIKGEKKMKHRINDEMYERFKKRKIVYHIYMMKKHQEKYIKLLEKLNNKFETLI